MGSEQTESFFGMHVMQLLCTALAAPPSPDPPPEAPPEPPLRPLRLPVRSLPLWPPGHGDCGSTVSVLSVSVSIHRVFNTHRAGIQSAWYCPKRPARPLTLGASRHGTRARPRVETTAPERRAPRRAPALHPCDPSHTHTAAGRREIDLESGRQ
jgi:hypothetical protein